MKKLIIICLLALSSTTLFAQITLDTTLNLGLIKLEKSGYKWYHYNTTSNIIMFYNLNYSLYKTVNIPPQTGIQYYSLNYITEVLFNTDSNDIEYLMTGFISGVPLYKWTKIYDENANLILFVDSAFIGWSSVPDNNLFTTPIVNTDLGTKMLLGYSGMYKIYSLPGHLECDFCEGTSAMITGNDPHYTIPTNALPLPYPNPSVDYVVIPYNLPSGEITGEIIICDELGNKVKSYKVGNDFTSLKISNQELSSGNYYYTLHTSKGIVGGRKIIVVK